jgi:hypothetical protein
MLIFNQLREEQDIKKTFSVENGQNKFIYKRIFYLHKKFQITMLYLDRFLIFINSIILKTMKTTAAENAKN